MIPVDIGCDEALTRFSFPVSTSPVPDEWIDEVWDEVMSRTTIPYRRVFDDVCEENCSVAAGVGTSSWL